MQPTVNLLLGMLLSLRYSPVRLWPHRRINIFQLHNWTAYLALFFTLAHPLVLLFVKQRHFGWFDILLPIRSPLQPKLNMAGAGALYLVLFTVVTSLLRTSIGRRLWRNLHYLVFPAAVLLFLAQHRDGSRAEGWQAGSAGWRKSLYRDLRVAFCCRDRRTRLDPWKRLSAGCR